MDRLATDDSPFWRFSLALYGQVDVPAACLRLQDECGADVNVMLFTLFLARAGRLIGSGDIDRMEAVAGPWRDEVVRPLRAVRRVLKSPPDQFQNEVTQNLRAAVQRIELEAERLQQLALERTLPAQAVGVTEVANQDCAARNLRLYAQRLGGFPEVPIALILRRLDDI
jgi:uncharacterized protein (TIGR02444 family)